MNIFKAFFGMDEDTSPALEARDKLKSISAWPHASYEDDVESGGLYKFCMNEGRIAQVAELRGLENDKEFMNLLAEAIKEASMEVSIKNMKMKRIVSLCRKESKKYSD